MCNFAPQISSLNQSDFKNKKYLGFFFLVYAISFLTDIFGFFDFIFPATIIFSCAFLHTSLLYAYINSLLVFGKKKIRKKVIFFGIISCVVGLVVAKIQSNTISEIYKLLSTVYFFGAYLLCIVQIIKHDKIVKQQYSDTSNRELKHFLVLFVLMTIFTILMPTLYVFLTEPYPTILIITFSCLWMFGITYIGLHYLVSKNLLDEPLPTIPLKEDKEEKEEKEEERYEELFAEIKNTITKDELFLNTDLTIMEVALAVNQHPKLVSKVINLNTDTNFNTFINDFRVKYAEKVLKNPKYKHITIDEIGKMSGFRSKSVFYSNFKRVLKITPLQFQNS